MKKQNILVILCDQLRRHALGVYGDPNVSTPNIDNLAQHGVRFSQASSTYPICVPFRFTMMTGEYAHSRFIPVIEWRMSPAETTLADEFNDAGYETIYCGKWHLHGGSGLLPPNSALPAARRANLTWIPREHQGRWQKWMGFELANNHFDTFYFVDADPSPKHLEGYQTDGLFDLTMDYLTERPDKNQPFMCMLSVEPPHFPLEAPEQFMAKWRDRDLSLTPNFLLKDTEPAPGKKVSQADRDQLIQNLRTYYAMIENLDWNVGRMMSFLDDKGLRDDTIVVFLSDHGQMDGCHCEVSTMKDHPYEESIGIPLIVSDPSCTHQNGLTIDTPVSTEDLFPTFLALAGLTPSRTKPGLDLTPMIQGRMSNLPREGVLLELVHDLRPASDDNPFHAFHYHAVYWRGFRTHRYKYTVLGDSEQGGKPWQFFDLQADPYETNNLISDNAHRELIAHHHRLMRQRMIDTNDHYVLAPAYGQDGMNQWLPDPL